MKAFSWKRASEAPEGWRLVSSGERRYSTWLTDEDELVLVPVQLKRCDECYGQGEIEDDEGWYQCPDCRGDGYIEGSEQYDFARAASKGAAVKLAKLLARHGSLPEWEWWAEAQS